MKPSPPYVEESELDRLEKIARVAFGLMDGDGEWHVEDNGEECGVGRASDDVTWVAVTGASGHAPPLARAQHIAAFDPAMCLALLSLISARKGQGIEGGSSQSQPCGASKHAAPEAEEPGAEHTLDTVARAWGLLWAVTADGHTRAGSNIQKARRALRGLLTPESQRGGIAMLCEDEQPRPEDDVHVG